MSKTILGIFPNRLVAEKAVAVLLEYGYHNDDVSIISKESREFAYEHPVLHSKTRTANNIILGILVGAILGALAGFGLSFVRGFQSTSIFNSIGIHGSLGVVFIGIILGLVIGALAGFAISSSRRVEISSYYQDSNSIVSSSGQKGQVMVVIPAADSEEQTVKDMLNRNGADNIKTIDANSRETNTTREASDFSRQFSPFRGGFAAGAKGGSSEANQEDKGISS